jgi:hypothetical protein
MKGAIQLEQPHTWKRRKRKKNLVELKAMVYARDF